MHQTVFLALSNEVGSVDHGILYDSIPVLKVAPCWIALRPEQVFEQDFSCKLLKI